MTITAKIIEDSVAQKHRRLTTFELRYPRFIHAEFMTHRQFSRNASSSRAIPVEKQIEMIMNDPAMPVHWGKNQSGMQAKQETDTLISIPTENGGCADVTAEQAWLAARDNAVAVARSFMEAGYHKQVVNRLLEPFSHITVVMTTTQLDNWFALRRHPDAQPEIKVLADAMFEALEASNPKMLSKGEWHLPYVTNKDRKIAHDLTGIWDRKNDAIDPWTRNLIAISVARCARVSYKTHDGKDPDFHKDMALYQRLVGSEPLHASPAEHQATPDNVLFNIAGLPTYACPSLHGNLQGGWCQYRKYLDNECVDDWDDPLNRFG